MPSTRLQAFKNMIRQDDYVVLDTETTGIYDGEIVQIAIVESSGIVLMDNLIKPVRPIPADATAIHGITDDMVKSAPGWGDVTGTIRDILNDRNVVVYNAIYDRKMMHRSADACGLPKTNWKSFSRWYCAMEAFAEVYGQRGRRGYTWQKLTTAAKHYNLPVRDAHSALGDSLMTLAMVKAMVKADVVAD